MSERLPACPNCGVAFAADRPAPNFCPDCGQEAVLHPPSVAEFAHEFVGHYVAVDGPLWRTLRLLLTRPGELTREYLRGRRRRYVLPLRLYLSASFLFFLAFKLLPGSAEPRELEYRTVAVPGMHGASALVIVARGRATSQALPGASAASADRRAGPPAPGRTKAADEGDPFECTGASAFCEWASAQFRQVVRHWRADPKAAEAEFSTHWFGSAPYAVFLMQPVFAGIVGWAYRRRRMRFGEHLVFAMHLHALWFMAGLAALLLPTGAGFVVALGVSVYTLFALRRVYGGRWAPTFARAAFIASVYGVLLGIVSLGITILAALH